MFVVSAVFFGLGFGSAYPIFVAHLMHHVAEHRRGATFGALIGAFDTGIGTGSIAVGWISERYGFGRAFGVGRRDRRCCRSRIFLFMEKRDGLACRHASRRDPAVTDYLTPSAPVSTSRRWMSPRITLYENAPTSATTAMYTSGPTNDPVR